jgi:hypothetical protein
VPVCCARMPSFKAAWSSVLAWTPYRPLGRGKNNPKAAKSRPLWNCCRAGTLTGVSTERARITNVSLPLSTGHHRDGDSALKAGTRESQLRACLDADRPRWGRACLRPRWRSRAVPAAPGSMIAASETTTRTAKIEIRTIPTSVPGMKAPEFAQVIRLGCDGQA